MPDNKVVFKIRDRATGLYKGRGKYGSWSKTGHAWTTAARVSGHLAMYGEVPANWEIVHLRTEEVAAQPVNDYILGRKILAEDKRRGGGSLKRYMLAWVEQHKNCDTPDDITSIRHQRKVAA